jgi:hypothetical protein
LKQTTGIVLSVALAFGKMRVVSFARTVIARALSNVAMMRMTKMNTPTTNLNLCPEHDCPLVLVFRDGYRELTCLECAAVLDPDDEIDLRDLDNGGTD